MFHFIKLTSAIGVNVRNTCFYFIKCFFILIISFDGKSCEEKTVDGFVLVRSDINADETKETRKKPRNILNLGINKFTLITHEGFLQNNNYLLFLSFIFCSFDRGLRSEYTEKLSIAFERDKKKWQKNILGLPILPGFAVAFIVFYQQNRLK